MIKDLKRAFMVISLVLIVGVFIHLMYIKPSGHSFIPRFVAV
jgi:hypothetical protein